MLLSFPPLQKPLLAGQHKFRPLPCSLNCSFFSPIKLVLSLVQCCKPPRRQFTMPRKLFSEINTWGIWGSPVFSRTNIMRSRTVLRTSLPG